MNKSFSSLIFILLFVALPFITANADSRDWTAPDIKGERFKLSEHLGEQPFVFVFWATWCVPCKKEMDELRGMFEGLMDKGVNVIFISEDTQKSQAKVKPYVESKGYRWPVLLDPDKEILKRYGGTDYIPYTVVLDRNGKVVTKTRGAIKDADSFRDKVIKLTATDEQ